MDESNVSILPVDRMRRSEDGINQRISVFFSAFRDIPPHLRMQAIESLLAVFNPLDKKDYQECLLSEVAKKMIYHSRSRDELYIDLLKESFEPIDK